MTRMPRREVMLGAAGLALAGAARRPAVSLVLAPSNLGLRPNDDGSLAGTWRTPQVLMAAGLAERLGARRVVRLARPAYQVQPQAGTAIRNGPALRRHLLEIAQAVRREITAGRFPLVVGGECSQLLGGLYGARLAGGRGLAHVDGHSDFFHPGNFTPKSGLWSVAGMDLALATGRGEALMTRWPGIEGPLVADEDAVQIGERFPDAYADFDKTGIQRLVAREALAMGMPASADWALARLRGRGLDRVWLHIDLDVLDERVMPAVDSPGTPGLDFGQLAQLLGALMASGRIVGANVGIYDPDRDQQGRYPGPIVAALAEAFARLQPAA